MVDTNETVNADEGSDATVSKTPIAKVAPLPGMLVEGTKVKILKTTLTGVVAEYHLSKDNKTFSYLVDFTEDGETHQKAFLHNQLEEIKEEA